jgi:hypothetical protein
MTSSMPKGARGKGWVLPAFLAVGAALPWIVFLAGAGMRSIVAWLLLQTAVPLAGVLAALGILGAAAWRRSRALLARRSVSAPPPDAPRRTSGARTAVALGLCAFCAWPLAWMFGLGALRFPVSIETVRPAATVRLPTDAPMRVVWGGDELEHNHHASFPDQRWAYDLAVDPVLTRSERLEDYGCWGVPVLAPAAGRVAAAHDGEEDHVPGRPSGDARAPLGNHVAVELPSGGFLVIAHLMKGSVSVAEGSDVAEGAPVGRCGNSGNTSEPHVHLHLQRQNPRDRPVNFSEGLPLFFRDHDGAAMPRGGIALVDQEPRATGDVVRHRALATASAAGGAPERERR